MDSVRFGSRPAFYRLRRRRVSTATTTETGDTPAQPSPSTPLFLIQSRLRCHFSIFGDGGGVCILPLFLPRLSIPTPILPAASAAAAPFFHHGGPLSPSPLRRRSQFPAKAARRLLSFRPTVRRQRGCSPASTRRIFRCSGHGIILERQGQSSLRKSLLSSLERASE